MNRRRADPARGETLRDVNRDRFADAIAEVVAVLVVEIIPDLPPDLSFGFTLCLERVREVPDREAVLVEDVYISAGDRGAGGRRLRGALSARGSECREQPGRGGDSEVTADDHDVPLRRVRPGAATARRTARPAATMRTAIVARRAKSNAGPPARRAPTDCGPKIADTAAPSCSSSVS